MFQSNLPNYRKSTLKLSSSLSLLFFDMVVLDSRYIRTGVKWVNFRKATLSRTLSAKCSRKLSFNRDAEFHSIFLAELRALTYALADSSTWCILSTNKWATYHRFLDENKIYAYNGYAYSGIPGVAHPRKLADEANKMDLARARVYIGNPVVICPYPSAKRRITVSLRVLLCLSVNCNMPFNAHETDDHVMIYIH